MRHSDAVLEDEQLVEIVCQALSKRCKKSKTRGRKGTPAEVVLRLLALKHMFNWSYDELHREVRANLVYREFTRIGGGKVPDDKTMGRLARQLGPEPVVVSIFEPTTEVIRGKAKQPTEFGTMVTVQEAETGSSPVMKCTRNGRATL